MFIRNCFYFFLIHFCHNRASSHKHIYKKYSWVVKRNIYKFKKLCLTVFSCFFIGLNYTQNNHMSIISTANKASYNFSSMFVKITEYKRIQQRKEVLSDRRLHRNRNCTMVSFGQTSSSACCQNVLSLRIFHFSTKLCFLNNTFLWRKKKFASDLFSCFLIGPNSKQNNIDI